MERRGTAAGNYRSLVDLLAPFHCVNPRGVAREALGKIAALYKPKCGISGRSPEERLRLRTERTAPMMTELHDWLQTTRSRISGRSELANPLRPVTLERADADPAAWSCVHL